MRGTSAHSSSGMRSSKALVVRGGLAHTFGGLAGFLALIFLCSGVYVLGDAFANPISAEAAALIFGAVMTAMATVLFYFLLGPTKRRALAGQKHARNEVPAAEREFATSTAAREARAEVPEDRASQRDFIERSGLRP